MLRRHLALALLPLGLAPASPALAQKQEQEAALADSLVFQDAAQYLRGALAALKAGRGAQATELLERAESRLLTRSTPAPVAGRPVTRGPAGDIAAARAAVGQRDFAGAQALTQKALEWLERRRSRR